MERLSQDLPRNMATEWTELSYLQKQASKLEQFRDLRQQPFAPSCWPWCSCSSCWPPSTRAGRCRWR